MSSSTLHESLKKWISPLFGRLVLLKPASGKSHRVEPILPAAGEWLRFCFVSREKDSRFKLPDVRMSRIFGIVSFIPHYRKTKKG